MMVPMDSMGDRIIIRMFCIVRFGFIFEHPVEHKQPKAGGPDREGNVKAGPIAHWQDSVLIEQPHGEVHNGEYKEYFR